MSLSGTVHDNQLTGAFGYGIALTSARNFTVENNVLIGNTSFIGARGPNCSDTDATPSPAAFVVDWNNTQLSTVQFEFQNVSDGDALTCILPPEGGDYWPFGGNPSPAPGESGTPVPSSGAQAGAGGNGLSGGAKAGIAIAVIFGVLGLAVGTWFIRRWAIRRATAQHAYARNMEQVS